MSSFITREDLRKTIIEALDSSPPIGAFDSSVDQLQPFPGFADRATDSCEVGEQDRGLTFSAEEVGFISSRILTASEFFAMPDKELDDLICIYHVGLRNGQFRPPQFPEISDHSLKNLSAKIKGGAREQCQNLKKHGSVDADLSA